MQTTKCSKCNQEVAENGQNVCSKCKRKRLLVWAGVASLFLIGGGVATYYYYLNEKQKNIAGFDGVGEYSDTMVVQEHQEIPAFNLENTTAIGSVVDANGLIDNIESFNRTMEQELAKAKENNLSQLQIPAVSTLFSLKSAELSSQGVALLKEYAKIYLQTNQQSVVLVEGYTCDIGTNVNNKKLSEQRANAVKSILLVNGIPQDKLEVKWYGEEKFHTFSYPTKDAYRRVNISIK